MNTDTNETLTIRCANNKDIAVIKQLDPHISSDMLIKSILRNNILVAFKADIPVGILRFNYFWDSIPFMNMLFITEEYRNLGYASQLVLYWESLMKSNGFYNVMTSTQANESSQHFYRKLCYEDSGSFFPPNEPLELILIKKL